MNYQLQPLVPDPFDVQPPLPRPERHPLRRPRYPFGPGVSA